jgi:DNA-binding Xre family transcriptional regulator
MAIGNNIAELLKTRGENVNQFSLGIGISYTTALDLYHGKTKMITFAMLNKLCKYFGVGPGEIFPYKPDPKDSLEKV